MFYSNRPTKRYGLLFLVASAFFTTCVHATPPLPQPLKANDTTVNCTLPTSLSSELLVAVALRCNAKQQAISSRWQAQQHQIDIAGSLDDPKLMLGAAPQTFNDNQTEDGYIVEFSQPIPWPGVLSLRKQAAKAKTGVWQTRYHQEQVVLARDIRLYYAQWQYHRRLLAINTQHQKIWEEFIRIVHTKYAAGTTKKSAALQATHQHHMLLQTEIEIAAQIKRDASQLKRLINLTPEIQLDNYLTSTETLPELPKNALSTLLSQLHQQPAMQGLQAQSLQKTQEIALAEKDRYPNLSFSTKYNSHWRNSRQRWTVGVSFNLPFDFGKRSSHESLLRAEKNAIQWEQQDLRTQLQEQLIQAYSYWEQAVTVYQLYQSDLLPLAQENLTTSRDEYQSNTGDFLSLLTAQQQLLTTQHNSETAIRDQFSQFAQLTAAAGIVNIDEWKQLNGNN